MGKRKSDLSRQTRQARRVKKVRSLETEEQRTHRLELNSQRIAAVRKKVAWLKSLETFIHLQENMKDGSELETTSLKEELPMHSNNDNFSSLKDDISEINQAILQKQDGIENDDEDENPSVLLKVQRISPYRKNIFTK